MAQRKEPKSSQHSNRYKMVVLSFIEPNSEGLGYYRFFVPKIKMVSFKEEVIKSGGCLEEETHDTIHYKFEGEGCVLAAHNLALPYMYKH